MIYLEDIKECNEYAQTGPKELARTVRFVLATIQQQLETVPRILTDFEQSGIASPYAWGMKKAGLTWLEENDAALYVSVMNVINSPRRLLESFLAVPGLGLVKAGFAAQLTANKVGCVDTHNLKLYDIPLNAVKYNYKLLPKTLVEKQKRYVDLCRGLGGSASLWSRWCDYVATARPANWADGREVSRFHCDVVTGREDGTIVDLFSGVDETPKFKQVA